MPFLSNKKAFSLIELMVTVAIMAILTAIVTSNFAVSKAKARDTKRISDLNSIQAALEMFYDRCGRYPIKTSPPLPDLPMPDINDGCLGIKLSAFISSIPKPSVAGYYAYHINNNSDPTDYILQSRVETASAGLLDDIDVNFDANKNSSGIILEVNNTIDPSAFCNNQNTDYFYCLRPN